MQRVADKLIKRQQKCKHKNNWRSVHEKRNYLNEIITIKEDKKLQINAIKILKTIEDIQLKAKLKRGFSVYV